MIRGAHAHISRGQHIPLAVIVFVSKMSMLLSQHALRNLINYYSLRDFE